MVTELLRSGSESGGSAGQGVSEDSKSAAADSDWPSRGFSREMTGGRPGTTLLPERSGLGGASSEFEEDEAEDESEESEDEAEDEIEDAGEEEEIAGDEDLSKLTVNQFKDMIRDIIAQEMGAGEAGEEELGGDLDGGDIEGMGDEAPIEEPALDGAEDEEEIDLDELLRELEGVSEMSHDEEEMEESNNNNDYNK